MSSTPGSAGPTAHPPVSEASVAGGTNLGAAGPIPRDAASLIVLRQKEGRPAQMLMARRGAGHRFMPNVLVFPGGSVDAADHAAIAATPLQPAVRERLERSATPSLAHALAIAAARELTEEVGLTLGASPDGPPHLGALDYLCRAITPPDRSMRFDARFFLVDAAHVQGDLKASRELEDPGWFTMAEALAQELALATKAVLGQLERWLAHLDRGGRVPVLRDRKWTEE